MLRDLLTLCPEDSVNKLPKCHGLLVLKKKKKMLVEKKASDEEYVALPWSHIIQTHQGRVFYKSSP